MNKHTLRRRTLLSMAVLLSAGTVFGQTPIVSRNAVYAQTDDEGVTQEEKDAAIAAAQAKADECEKAYKEAEAEYQAKCREYEAAYAKRDEMRTLIDSEPERVIAQLESELADKKAELEALKAQLDDSEDVAKANEILNTLESERKAANDAFQEKQDAYDAAVRLLEAVKNNDEEYLESYIGDLNKQIAAKEAEVNTLKSSLESKQTELAKANEELEAARTAFDKAEADGAAKSKAAQDAADELAKAIDEYDAANAEYEAAIENNLDVAERRVANQEQIESVNQAISDKEQEIEDLKAQLSDPADLEKALAAAKAVYNQGSKGFFQYLADQGDSSAALAVSILEDGILEDYLNLGASDDATNLDNMKKVFDWIRECNQLRTSDDVFTGCENLLVSSPLMAISRSS